MSTTWKKAFSTLATAGLLASLLGTAFAAPVSAVGQTATLTATRSSALADGVATALVGLSSTVDSGDSVKVEVTGGATFSAVTNAAFTVNADKTSATWTNNGGNASSAGSTNLGIVSTKVGSFKVTVYTKAFGFDWVKADEETVSFSEVSDPDLATPAIAITSGACTNGRKNDPSTIDEADAAGAAYYGTARACAWALLRQNSGTSGDSDIDVTKLTTWTFSIDKGLFNSKSDGTGTPGTTMKDSASVLTDVSAGGLLYTGAGATIYSNNTVGKATVTWTGTYRGKAYSATGTLTFIGSAVSFKLEGGFSAAKNGTGTLTYSAFDSAGSRTNATAGDVTTASSAATVATAVAADSTTGSEDNVTVTCLKAGTATITLKSTHLATQVSTGGVTVTCGSGTAATVAVSAPASKVGSIVTVTVTVKDKDGLAVTDGTNVTALTNAGYFLVGTNLVSGTSKTTAEGVATFKLWAPATAGTVNIAAFAHDASGAGTVTITSSGATAASGITARVGTGSYASTTRVAKPGQTITWRANVGTAGASVGVYQRSRNADGTWSTIRRWATRTADASGNVTFSYKYGASKWIQIRFVATGASTSFLGGVWR